MFKERFKKSITKFTAEQQDRSFLWHLEALAVR